METGADEQLGFGTIDLDFTVKHTYNSGGLLRDIIGDHTVINSTFVEYHLAIRFSCGEYCIAVIADMERISVLCQMDQQPAIRFPALHVQGHRRYGPFDIQCDFMVDIIHKNSSPFYG